MNDCRKEEMGTFHPEADGNGEQFVCSPLCRHQESLKSTQKMVLELFPTPGLGRSLAKEMASSASSWSDGFLNKASILCLRPHPSVNWPVP